MHSHTFSLMRSAAPLPPLSSKVMGAWRSRFMAAMLGSAAVASSAAISAASLAATGCSTCHQQNGDY